MLYDKKETTKQFLMFCVVGGISTILNYISFVTLVFLNINYLLASAIGYLVGVFIGFGLNKRFTFFGSCQPKLLKKYLMLYTFSLITGLLFLRVLVHLDINVYVANIFMIGLTTTLNFIGSKFYVFEYHNYQKYMEFFLYRHRYLFRYLVIGFISLLIESVFIEFLKNTFTNATILYISGFIIGMLFAFYFNIKMNFPVHKSENVRVFRYFVLISLFSFLINSAFIHLLFQKYPYYIPRVIIAGCLSLLIYFLHRKITFRQIKDVGVAIYTSKNENISSIKSKIGFYPDFIHIDLVDDTYNSTEPPYLDVIKDIYNEWTFISKMLHIMSKHPKDWIQKTHQYVEYIIFHSDIEDDICDVIHTIKKFNKKVGISIFHYTDIDDIEPYLSYIQVVQVLGIASPGRSGQSMELSALKKVDELKELQKKYSFEICFDGGVKLTNIHTINAKYIVSASTILSSVSPIKTIFDLKMDSRFHLHDDTDMKQFLLKNIKSIIESFDFIKSGTLVGSFTDAKAIQELGDIDIVVILDKLTKSKFEMIVNKFHSLSPIIKANYDYDTIINITFAPIKFNKEKTLVFHLMIYDIEGHITHCKKSPFTCMDWQNSKTFFKSSMSEIYNIPSIYPSDFLNVRRSSVDYLSDLSRSVISYREYVFRNEDSVEEIKKEKPMTNKDHFDFAYHIMKFTILNFIKLYHKNNTINDFHTTTEEYFSIYPKNKLEYIKYITYLRDLKTNNKYRKWDNDDEKLLYDFLTDFQEQFNHMFFVNSTRILFFRHCNVEIDQENIFIGQRSNPDIKPDTEKINNLKEFLKDKVVHKIYSSPLNRCIQTSNLLLETTGLNEIILNMDITEINYGDMDGKTFEDMKYLYPSILHAWARHEDVSFPNGENNADVSQRMNRFLASVTHYGNGYYLVCTHNVFLRCLVGMFLKIPIHKWHTIKINHLDPIEFILTKNREYYINLSEEQKNNMVVNNT